MIQLRARLGSLGGAEYAEDLCIAGEVVDRRRHLGRTLPCRIVADEVTTGEYPLVKRVVPMSARGRTMPLTWSRLSVIETGWVRVKKGF